MQRMSAILDNYSTDFSAGVKQLIQPAGITECVLQNHRFKRAEILYQDFTRVDTEVFIDIQIYGDCLTNLDGLHDGKAGKGTHAYFIAGIDTERL